MTDIASMLAKLAILSKAVNPTRSLEEIRKEIILFSLDSVITFASTHLPPGTTISTPEQIPNELHTLLDEAASDINWTSYIEALAIVPDREKVDRAKKEILALQAEVNASKAPSAVLNSQFAPRLRELLVSIVAEDKGTVLARAVAELTVEHKLSPSSAERLMRLANTPAEEWDAMVANGVLTNLSPAGNA